MNVFFPAGMTRRSIPRSLAVVVCLVSLVVATTPRAATAPRRETRSTSRFVLNSDRLLRMQRSGSAHTISDVIAGGGAFSVSIDRAVFDLDESSSGRFVLGGLPRGEEFVMLGSSAATTRGEPGQRPEGVLDWDRMLTYRVARSGEHVTISYSVGDDRFSLAIPRVALGPEAEWMPAHDVPPVRVEVNGAEMQIDAAALTRDREVVPYLDAREQRSRGRELSSLFGHLGDPERFVNAIEGVHRMTGLTDMLALSGTSDSCMGPCLSCAGGLAAVVGAAAATGISCGGTVFTSGLTLSICWAALITSPATVVIAAANCSGCDHCVRDSRVRPKPLKKPRCDPCHTTLPCDEPEPESGCEDDGDMPR